MQKHRAQPGMWFTHLKIPIMGGCQIESLNQLLGRRNQNNLTAGHNERGSHFYGPVVLI